LVKVDLSKEAEKKLDEFEDLIKKAYEKYMEFYDVKCKACGNSCTDIHKLFESSGRFLMSVFYIVMSRIHDETGIGSHLVDGFLLNFIIKQRIIDFFEKLSEDLAKYDRGDQIYIG